MIREIVIDMNETQLRTIEQIEQFLNASAVIEFSAVGNDSERHGHISRVLTRFDYAGRSKRDRGCIAALPAAHQRAQPRAQATRLVARWHGNWRPSSSSRATGRRRSPLHVSTRPPMWPCSSKWTTLTRTFAGRPSCISFGVPTASMATRAMNVWRRSPPCSCTTCTALLYVMPCMT